MILNDNCRQWLRVELRGDGIWRIQACGGGGSTGVAFVVLVVMELAVARLADNIMFSGDLCDSSFVF